MSGHGKIEGPRLPAFKNFPEMPIGCDLETGEWYVEAPWEELVYRPKHPNHIYGSEDMNHLRACVESSYARNVRRRALQKRHEET